MRCATCRPAPRSAARRTWCAPARRPTLDPLQLRLLLDQVPGTLVHADLAAFAEHMLGRDAELRGDRAPR